MQKNKIQERRDEIIHNALLRAQEAHESRVQMILDRCESPIEKMLALEFYEDSDIDPDIGFLLSVKNMEELKEFISNSYKAEGYGESCIYIIPQCRLLEKYRADFVIVGFNERENAIKKIIVIECDGHNYHERTKEQAERDRSRDRALVRAGYTVLRFTGREIYRNARKCADEALDAANG